MLKQRVITALVLLAVLVPAMLASNPIWFDALTLLLMAAGAWEWARLQGLSERSARVSGVVMGALLASTHWSPAMDVDVRVVAWLAVIIWLPGTAWMLRHGLTRWSQVSRTWRLGLGWVVVALAWWALVATRAVGLNHLLSVLTLVWAADIAAYFGGRAFGQRKLAPSISPGKTWAGAVSGALAVLALGALWLQLDQRLELGSLSIYSVLWQRSPLWWALGGACLVAASVLGDLMESLVKRVAGVKDSSGLLPGHGGVLDRVDALLPVLPIALWLSGV